MIGRPGSDRLSRVLRHSTIGAEEFNGRVRDGIGFRLLARATRPAKHNDEGMSEDYLVFMSALQAHHLMASGLIS